MELALQHAVVAPGLLLLTQLGEVLGLLPASPATMFTRGVGSAVDATLVGEAPLAFEEELLAFPPALLALR